MDDYKMAYLQMIQEPICRMSTISSVLKGFSVMITTGLAAVGYVSENTIILILSFLPIVSFMMLDIYYLRMERLYRHLFEMVRLDRHPIDFDMKLGKDS